jgi:hypothetical protein
MERIMSARAEESTVPLRRLQATKALQETDVESRSDVVSTLLTSGGEMNPQKRRGDTAAEARVDILAKARLGSVEPDPQRSWFAGPLRGAATDAGVTLDKPPLAGLGPNDALAARLAQRVPDYLSRSINVDLPARSEAKEKATPPPPSSLDSSIRKLLGGSSRLAMIYNRTNQRAAKERVGNLYGDFERAAVEDAATNFVTWMTPEEAGLQEMATLAHLTNERAKRREAGIERAYNIELDPFGRRKLPRALAGGTLSRNKLKESSQLEELNLAPFERAQEGRFARLRQEFGVDVNQVHEDTEEESYDNDFDLLEVAATSFREKQAGLEDAQRALLLSIMAGDLVLSDASSDESEDSDSHSGNQHWNKRKGKRTKRRRRSQMHYLEVGAPDELSVLPPLGRLDWRQSAESSEDSGFSVDEEDLSSASKDRASSSTQRHQLPKSLAQTLRVESHRFQLVPRPKLEKRAGLFPGPACRISPRTLVGSDDSPRRLVDSAEAERDWSLEESPSGPSGRRSSVSETQRIIYDSPAQSPSARSLHGNLEVVLDESLRYAGVIVNDDRVLPRTTSPRSNAPSSPAADARFPFRRGSTAETEEEGEAPGATRRPDERRLRVPTEYPPVADAAFWGELGEVLADWEEPLLPDLGPAPSALPHVLRTTGERFARAANRIEAPQALDPYSARKQTVASVVPELYGAGSRSLLLPSVLPRAPAPRQRPKAGLTTEETGGFLPVLPQPNSKHSRQHVPDMPFPLVNSIGRWIRPGVVKDFPRHVSWE